jgi:hypothetical protein
MSVQHFARTAKGMLAERVGTDVNTAFDPIRARTTSPMTACWSCVAWNSG